MELSHCRRVDVEAWRHGALEARYRLEVWRSRFVEASYKCSDVEAWKYEGMELWSARGALQEQRRGCIEVWSRTAGVAT